MLMTSLRTSTAIALIFMAQFALSRPALAGGVAEPVIEPNVITPIVPLSWEGPYAGVQIGCSWLNEDDGIQSENGPCGAVGGAYLGYNFEARGNLVWGGEIGFNISDQKFGGDGTLGYSVSTNWEASLRLRLGYIVADRTMIYTAGGLAFADADMSGVGSNTHSGWTVGIGVEHAFSQRWNGRFEVRYNDYGSETYNSPSQPIDVEFGNTQALFGLSYKF